MLSLFKQFLTGARKAGSTTGRLASKKAAPDAPILSTPKSGGGDIHGTADPDARQQESFDPYNTGSFDRSGSWERINKRRNG